MKHLKLSLLFLLCVLMAVPVSAKRKTKVIAHRGYWKTEGAAQNSIRSLERANEIKVYGSEFDVHLTADNVPVVYHDRKIEGKDIQTASYAELKDLKLSNGETLPTLEQYLDRAKKLKKTKLIFELKSHATPLRDREAAKIVVDMVNGKKLTKRTEYIAFSLEAAKELHRLSPKTPVYYLNGDLSPKQLKELLVFRQLSRYLVKRVAAHFNRVQRRPGSLFLQVGSTSVPKLQDIQSRVIHSRSIHAAELSVYPLGILFAVHTGSSQPVAGSTRDRVIAGKTGVMIKIEPQRYLGRIGRDGSHQRLHWLIGKFFGDGRCRIVLLTDILRPGKQDRLFVAIEVCPPVHRHVRILGGRHGT